MGRTRSDVARRKKSARELRMVKMAEMYHRGVMLKDIAKALKVTRFTIYRDLQELHHRWVERASTMIDRAKVQQLQRLAWTEEEMSEAWEKSKEPGIVEQEEVITGEEGGTRKSKRTVKYQVGDKGYVDTILKAVSERCKIMGMYAPVKLEGVERDGRTPLEIRAIFEGMSEKDREALRAPIREYRQRLNASLGLGD